MIGILLAILFYSLRLQPQWYKIMLALLVPTLYGSYRDIYENNRMISCYLGNGILFWLSSHMSTWSSISFKFAVLINLLVAAFFPFSGKPGGRGWAGVGWGGGGGNNIDISQLKKKNITVAYLLN